VFTPILKRDWFDLPFMIGACHQQRLPILQRSKAVGGKAEIQSSVKGTVIVIDIPVE
jgi:hypothetical protein